MRKLYSLLFSFIFITSAFAQIPTTGLLGEWTFTNGQLLDAFNTYPAVAQPGAVPTEDRFGNANYAYDLPPAAYLTFGDIFDGNTNGTINFTFSYWVKFDQINNTYRYMLGKAGFPSCGVDARQFAFLIDANNRVEAQLFGALTGGHVRYRSNGTVAANAWTHIVFAVDVNQLVSGNLSGMKIFINGVPQAISISETVGSGLTSNGMDNGVAHMSAARYAGQNGVSCGTTQYMDGQFDDLRVYNRVLSLAEVTQLYEYVPCAPTAVTVQPASTVAFCAGSSAQLNIELADPNASTAWQVNTGNGWGYLGNQTGEVSVAGQYRVEIVSPCGAYSYSNVTTVVVDAPVFTVTPVGYPQQVGICPGATEVILEANAVGEDITYQWMQQDINGIWTNIVGADGPTYAATEVNTSYNVSISACGASATTTPFFVSTAPTASIAVTVYDPSSSICAGNSVRLLTSSSGGGGSVIVWEPGGVVDANPTFYPTETTTYTGTITTPAGCTASTTATVTVLGQQPSITNNAGTLEVTGGPYTYISWKLNGTGISGATFPTYTPVEDGNYTVWISQDGCTNTSAPYAYADIATGINGVEANGLKIYPNPFNTEFVIETTAATTITIINTVGEVVLSRTINGRTSIDATTLSAGIYFVREETSGAVMKLVKN